MWTQTRLESSRRQVKIAGQVKDGQTDRAIPRALISMDAMPEEFLLKVNLLQELYGGKKRPDQTRTDSDGYFYFLDLPVGDYTLRVMPGVGTRYGTATAQMRVSEDASGAIANISLPPTSVSGTVTGENNKPLVMARIQVENSGEYTFSNSQGNYSLAGLESGKHRVRVSALSYPSKVEEVVLNQGQMQTLNISLTPAP